MTKKLTAASIKEAVSESKEIIFLRNPAEGINSIKDIEFLIEKYKKEKQRYEDDLEEVRKGVRGIIKPIDKFLFNNEIIKNKIIQIVEGSSDYIFIDKTQEELDAEQVQSIKNDIDKKYGTKSKKIFLFDRIKYLDEYIEDYYLVKSGAVFIGKDCSSIEKIGEEEKICPSDSLQDESTREKFYIDKFAWENVKVFELKNNEEDQVLVIP